TTPPLSELQPGLARGVGEGLDAAVILIATALEADLVNTGGPGPLGHQPADDRGGGLVAAVAGLLAEARLEGAGRGEGGRRVVVDDLRVDVLGAAEDRQPGPLGVAVQLLADVPLAAEPLPLDVQPVVLALHLR